MGSKQKPSGILRFLQRMNGCVLVLWFQVIQKIRSSSFNFGEEAKIFPNRQCKPNQPTIHPSIRDSSREKIRHVKKNIQYHFSKIKSMDAIHLMMAEEKSIVPNGRKKIWFDIRDICGTY